MRRTAIACLLAVVLVSPAAAQGILAPNAGPDATEANSQPKLARDASGAISFVYAAPSGGVSQIYLARSTDGGVRWQIVAVTSARVPSRYPTLAVDRQGAVHVAWTQYDGGTGRVYYARYDRGRWTAPVRVSVGQPYAGVPSIAVDAAGVVHLVWYGIRPQAPEIRTKHGSIYEILYTHSQDGGWSPPLVISPGIPDAINPALGLDASGRLHSAWYQFDSRVYQVRYAQRDRAWSKPVEVSTGGSDAAAVAMAVAPDGTVHLVWEQRSSAGIRIFYAQKHPTWSGQQQISPSTQRACCPTVAVDAQGRVYVVWESDGQVYLRRRNGTWSGTDRVTARTDNHNPILSGSGTHVDLVWSERSGQRWQLHFATMAGGAPGGRGPGPSPLLRTVLLIVVLGLLTVWQVRRMRARHQV